ncbi:MAG TPA: PLP-dependent aminotransferase family protein [Clostridiaceae bacterium]
MEKYKIKFYEEKPKYIQVYEHIKDLIESNLVDDGEKLPSIRGYSKILGVNTITIVNSYKALANEGYTYQKEGSGTFAKKKDRIKYFKKEYNQIFKRLAGGQLGSITDFTSESSIGTYFPVVAFKDILNEVIDRDGSAAFINQEPLGFQGLRNCIKDFLWKGTLDVDNILIVSGAQQGIDIIAKALIAINDGVLIEKPTYSGALNVFTARRANIFEVDMEADGANIIQLEKLLKKSKIKCFYIMSYFQNPTGSSYSNEKKKAILDLAEKYDFYIIEDDYLSELIYDDNIKYESFKNLDTNERVIYIKSFSKIFLPGIRLGYLITPEIFRDQIQSAKVNSDISTSGLMQRALELYIVKGLWKDYIDKIKIIYKIKYENTLRNIYTILGDKVRVNPPGGGLSFYLNLKENVNIDSIELFYRCREKNIYITPGVLFYKFSNEGRKYFRLGFSQPNEDRITEGIKTISTFL